MNLKYALGSTPGPVCYRKNGFLTVTDANLVLGRIIPEYFPHIFGKSEAMPLDKYVSVNHILIRIIIVFRDASLQAFERITEEINTFLESEGRSKITVPQVALGFIQVANESMCRPIRTLTEVRSF